MKEMTLQEVQQVSLDILKDVHSFCILHNIRYSLGYGSLLGAVRHKGFIPWDDDIDIVMPRPDFDRFCKEFQSSDKYTLVKPDDKNSFFAFARLCDVERTCVYAKRPWTTETTGLWIDILPLDGLPSDEEEFFHMVKDVRKLQKKIYRVRTGRLLALSQTLGVKDFFYCLIKRVLYYRYDVRDLLNKHIQILRSNSYENSAFVGQICVMDYPEKEHNPKSDFRSFELLRFCDMDFYVMSGYKNVLKRYFGNYMELPPEDKRYKHDNNIYYWK